MNFKSNSHEFFCVVWISHMHELNLSAFSPSWYCISMNYCWNRASVVAWVFLLEPSASDFLQDFSFSLFFTIQGLSCTRTVWWELVMRFELGAQSIFISSHTVHSFHPWLWGARLCADHCQISNRQTLLVLLHWGEGKVQTTMFWAILDISWGVRKNSDEWEKCWVEWQAIRSRCWFLKKLTC